MDARRHQGEERQRRCRRADIANYNLVLFGDPGSNSVIAKVVGSLPIQWTRSEITVGAQKFPTADHALVLIYPNPLNPQKYVVLNTGQTFSANRITSGTEAVFFPRLGDYAVLTTGGQTKMAGFFDESWKLKQVAEESRVGKAKKSRSQQTLATT